MVKLVNIIHINKSSLVPHEFLRVERNPENKKSENHKVNRIHPEKTRRKNVPQRENGVGRERFSAESPDLWSI